uniref:Uncharacterized protein n=1 Tax=Magallana gigas TaxID=29159 RepID=A0A8W8MIT1_MAGGI
MFNQLTSICVLFYLNAEVFCSSPSDKYYNPKIHNCTDCPSGYYGSNCSNSCRYPSYGVDCQEECQCAKKACDHVFGCSSYELNEIIRLFSLSIATQCRYDKYYNTKIHNCTGTYK